MLSAHRQKLKQLELLDFADKGEAFVESKFVTPLLECLGYETHKDYEVARHGDNGTTFKLQYPPVEKGALRVKHYQPDYVPTIRKKAFWVIEAKSPKDVTDPFEEKYIVQGMQYCIHPEIQAKYLYVTNGTYSAVYDAHGAVFFGKAMYEPILEFRSLELVKRWLEIYELLSVEKLRTRIESDLKAMYDKLCLSSLDKDYPFQLLRSIGASSRENSQRIEKHVNKLHVEGMDQSKAAWRKEMEQSDLKTIFLRMDLPLGPGECEANYFVKKSLEIGRAPDEIMSQLINDFEQQSIFRKEQTFVAVCVLHQLVEDPVTKESIRTFVDQYKNADLPLLNQVECAHLRVTHKITVVSIYPELRKRITEELRSAPELIRFVQPPTAFDKMYPVEILHHETSYDQFRRLSGTELLKLLDELLKVEVAIEQQFEVARSKLPASELQICDFAFYGVGGKHYAFKNILHNFGIERRDDLNAG